MAQLDTMKASTARDGASASPRAGRLSLTFRFAIAGALSFWLPDVAVHIAAGPNFSSRHIWVITTLMPATFLFAYVVARKFAVERDFKWLGVVMLLGVWLSGGLFMTLAAVASGSGLVGVTGVGYLIIIVLSVIPIVTYLLASADGSLLALLMVTLGSLLACGVRASWMLLTAPPPPDSVIARERGATI